MPTVGSLFSGGEVAGEGMRTAGYEHRWGLESDDAIAQNARDNGFNIVTGDVLQADPHTFERVDALHASPPCPNFSVAKTGGAETDLDIALGDKVAQFVTVLRPSIFTLENVWAYRNSQSLARITAALDATGYMWDYKHLCAADFGVPQSRRRLILRAVRGRLLPHLPAPVPGVGWYAAIEDLIPTLPASKFAPWQLARLPEEVMDTTMFAQGKYGDNLVTVDRREPIFAVTANSNQTGVRAFIVSNSKTEWGEGQRGPDAPMITVTTQMGSHPPRAFLVHGTSTLEVRDEDQPAAVVVGTVNTKAAMPRAFLVDGQNGRVSDRAPTKRYAQEPSMTICAAAGHRPANAPRAWLAAGRVVSMTPRALARFQSLPDTHSLPAKASLACRIIGNGWPSLMAQRIYEGLKPQ